MSPAFEGAANGGHQARPDVSVLIATHRRTDLLCEALRSVLDQTLDNVEIIVVDDAGEDATADAVAKLAQQRDTIRYFKRSDYTEKSGGLPSRNVATKLCSGRYVLYLDDDDLLASSCLERRMAVLEEKPDLDFCVGQCAVFEGTPKLNDGLWCTWTDDQDDLLMFLSNAVPWQTSGPLWRRSALNNVGAWDESLGSGWDYEYHIRALAIGARGARIPIVDYHWRMPRADSYSGFEAFKRQHRAGHHVTAFCKGIDAVGRHGQWTSARKRAAWREAIRLAVVCRLHGGSRHTAQASIDTARRWGCGSAIAYFEATACVAAWIKVSSKLLPLSYIARRKLIDV
jgi:glycosyltransferase involved in cell wall biosynthesis